MHTAADRYDQNELRRAGSQSRLMSLIEAITNVIVGFVFVFATQLALFPTLGLVASVSDNVLIGGVFTAISLARSYMLRRLFDALR